MRTLTIELGERSYPIHIGDGLLHDDALLNSLIDGNQVLIISNDTVAPLYLERIRRGLQDRQSQTLILPDGEAYKNADSWQQAIDVLVSMRASRDVTILALGGGVVGDLAGFVAATWMRGVPFVQLPTTLLAQVDASVGGKTAINLDAGKNLVGSFHQPRGVLIDLQVLSTLPEREYIAGLAEVIKYGLIRDAAFVDWLEQSTGLLVGRDPETVAEAIERSCQHKAEVVAEDERESGVRALLNLGHSFGHAIEAVAGYGEILHGEAVAIGCCAAARLSRDLGRLAHQEVERIERLLSACGLPVTIPPHLDSEALVQAMELDKKNLSGRIRLVLMDGIGAALVSDEADRERIAGVIDTLRVG